MSDDKNDTKPESMANAGLSRREALTGGLAAVGLAAVPNVSGAAAGGTTADSTRVPQTGRGYFQSNGAMYIPRAQGFDATNAAFYEAPVEDPRYLEVFCYTDRLSYAPGEEVQFHTSTTAKELSIEVLRDGKVPVSVHKVEKVKGELHKLRPEFYEKGCGWPVSHTWRLPEDLPSGFYLVISRVIAEEGLDYPVSTTAESLISRPRVREQEHGFFVRRAKGKTRSDVLFVSSTSTWTAYNDWGGFSHYVGYNLPDKFLFAPRLSIQRPFARGFIRLPVGAPRKPHQIEIAQNSIPLYPVIEFAFTRGYSKWFANAGWATYERPFALFAESNGFEVDYATQHDLHYDPQLLDGYKCVVMVGHCEYWTWEMREAIDRYVERGGNVARFAGNFGYQIRLEDEGRTQVAYKGRAHDSDPVRTRRMTADWEAAEVDWYGAETFGLNSCYGVYAHVGVNAPRGTGGFTVYRPEHWAFEGTDLYYGDDFGSKAKIFGYEVDGLDYTFRDGLPFPTYKDRARPGTEILAMALASNIEPNHGHRGSVFYYGDITGDIAPLRYRSDAPEAKQASTRASGMIVTFQRGAGTVFHAGSSEWVAGLQYKDPYTEIITRNVLNRFTGRSKAG